MGQYSIKAGGITKPCDQWGVTIQSISYNSLAADEVVIVETGRVADRDEGDLFPYGTEIEIFLEDTVGGVTSTKRIFAGEIIEPRLDEVVQSAQAVYRAQNAWGVWMEKVHFKWTVKIEQPPASGTYIDLKWSHVWLGYRVSPSLVPGTAPYFAERISVGQQMVEILNRCLQAAAIESKVPFQFTESQLTDIDLLGLTYEHRNIYCAEAFEVMARLVPGVGYFDYTVDPPAFNYRTNENFVAPLLINLADCAAHNVTELPHLKRDVVALTYEVRAETGGYNPVEDIWPPGSNTDGRNVHADTVDMDGPRSNQETVTIETEPILFFDPAWLAKKMPELLEAAPDGARIANMVITNLNLPTYAAELLSGSLPAWAGASAKDKLKLKIAYDVVDATTSQPIYKVRDQYKVLELVSTNKGSQTITRTTAVDGGDPLPDTGEGGLAHELWKWMSQTQRVGQIVIEDEEPFRIVATVEGESSPTVVPGLGYVLSLTGGKLEWENMRAQIQSVLVEPEPGRMTINFGFPRHLELADHIALARASRNRVVFSNPQEQAGILSAGGDDAAGNVRNNARGGTPPVLSYQRIGQSFGASDWAIISDASGQLLRIGTPTDCIEISSGRLRVIKAGTAVIDLNGSGSTPKIDVAAGGKTISIDIADLPSGATARHRAMTIKVGGSCLTFYPLATSPA